MPNVPGFVAGLLLVLASAPAVAQIVQSPTSVSIRGDRGTFSVTYRSGDVAFEPGRGTLCTEVRDARTGQTIGPAQLSGRPVRCAGRILDRAPRPRGSVRQEKQRDLTPGRKQEGAGIYRFRDRVRLNSGASELAVQAVRESAHGVVYWVRDFQLNRDARESEVRNQGIAVAVRPSGNALTGSLAVLSADVYVISDDGGRIEGAIRVDPDTEDARLQARLRSSGSGQIVAYWVVRRAGQSRDRSTWRRVSQATFRTSAVGRQLVTGPRLGDLPLDRPGRYDVSLYVTSGARDIAAIEAPAVTVWRAVD